MNIHSKFKTLLILGGTITAFQTASAVPPSEKSPADASQNSAPSAAEPAQRPAIAPAPAGDAALTPKALTKGTVLKIKVALSTVTNWNPNNGSKPFAESDSDFNDESLIWKTPTSYADSGGDEFSCVYKKIDNFTAQITFDETKNSEGTLQNERGTGKLILLFTSYDKATSTLYGTVVTSDSYTGDGKYGSKPDDYGNYKDFSSGSGIFSLKIK